MLDASEGSSVQDSERKIARTPGELPDLLENHVRAVHITQPHYIEDILEKGLDYSRYGMAQSTARAWGDAEQVEWWSDDPIFSYPGAMAVIMDMTNLEWRGHNTLSTAPGVICPERIVGVFEAVKPNK